MKNNGLNRHIPLYLSFALIVILLSVIFTLSVSAAPEENIPVTLTQPDGTVINCLASGDEYFNYYHDEAGNLIKPNAETGWYEYVKVEDGQPVSNGVRVGEALVEKQFAVPEDISEYVYEQRIESYEYMYNSPAALRSEAESDPLNTGAISGNINTIVVFISFKDDSLNAGFTDGYFTNRAIEGGKFGEVLSSKLNVDYTNYFKEISDSTINTTAKSYPISNGTVYSYIDSHNRAYYSEEVTNETIRRDREFALLESAINAVSGQIDTTLNYDINNDEKIDNIVFVVGTQNDAWASLLWSHKWSLHTKTVKLNGLQVYDYSFDMVTSLVNSFYTEHTAPSLDITTMFHETLHVFGFPDLYVYENQSIMPVGKFDIMANGDGHPTMYTKSRWGGSGWVDNRIKPLTALSAEDVTLTNSTAVGDDVTTSYKLPKALTGYNKDIFIEYFINKGFNYSTDYSDYGIFIYETNDALPDNTYPSRYNGDYALYVFRNKNGWLDAQGESADITLDNGYTLRLYNITYKDSDGNFTDDCTFNYEYYRKTDSVTPVNMTVPVNEEIVLSASVSPASCKYKTVEWAIDSTNTLGGVTLNNGVFKSTNTGTETLIASVRNTMSGTIECWAYCTITVSDDVAAPVFTIDLSNTYTFTQNNNASLSVTAVNQAGFIGDITYQWYTNTERVAVTDETHKISGETNSSMRIDTSETGSKYYYCKATSSYGDVSESTVSSIAEVTIEKAPRKGFFSMIIDAIKNIFNLLFGWLR